MKPFHYSLLTFALLAGAAARGQTAVSAADASENTIELSPFLVEASENSGYGTASSLGASRIALGITEIPVSVVSLNERIFSDLGAVDGPEVLKLVSGIQQGADGAPGQAGFSLRGFSAVGLRIRDGLPEIMEGVDYAFDDSADYEALEVIKGPAGTLYGTTNMGGVVNKISKWPKFIPVTKLELQAQTNDRFIRGMIDSTGPLSENTAYRAVLSVRRGDRFYDEDDAPNDFTNAMIAFTHRIGPEGRKTGKLWARFQSLHFKLDRESGPQFITGYLDPTATDAPIVSSPVFGAPKDISFGPDDDVSIADIYGFEAGYEQTFAGPMNGDWTLRLVGRYSDGQGDKSPSYALPRPIPVDANGQRIKYTNASGALVNGDSRQISANDPRVADWRVTMTARKFDGYNKTGGGFLDLVGNFDTGPLHHQVVFNTQLQRSIRERAFFFWAVPNAGNTTAVANSYSIFDDLSDMDIKSIMAAQTTSFNPFNGNSEANAFASGFQDNIGLWDERLIVVLGARYDNVHTRSYTFNPAESIARMQFVPDPASTSSTTNQEWTTKYGLVGKLMPGLSLFGQIGETYIPVNSLDASGAKYPNRIGEIREVGLKSDLWDGRLVATASVFKMELTNVLISVPNPPELGGGTVLQPAGTQKTDGFEVDISYAPTSNIDLMVGYSNLESTNEAGRYFRGVPTTANWSAMGRYSFNDGALDGLFVGAIWKHNGRFSGDTGNTFFVDSSDIVDAFIGYGRDRWSVQLNVLNLTDSDAIVTTVADNAAFRANDRTFRLTTRFTF